MVEESCDDRRALYTCAPFTSHDPVLHMNVQKSRCELRGTDKCSVDGIEYISHRRRDSMRKCKMCTFDTGASAVSGEGENSTNTLENYAKTAAKINDHQLKAGGFKSFRRTSPPTERENG